MPRAFNTTGPCIPSKHYMLSPEPRMRRVLELVDQKKYFTLTAGWQTGKTTAAKWLTGHYNAGDRYAALWVDIQTAREEPDLQKAMRTVMENLDHAVRRDLPAVARPVWQPDFNPATVLLDSLRELCARAPRPLVVLFDEADGLVGPPMVSFLTQLRQGYLDRDKVPFPRSVVLVGRRQVRDYVMAMEDRRAVSWLGTSSPFNITAEAAVLAAAFSAEEVVVLLGQHTTDTAQRFLPEAAQLIHDLSCGHPWLVNALADQITDRDLRDRGKAVSAAHVEAAKETIILERRSHIDSLIARLHEPRVQRVVEPMLTGEHIPSGGTLNDDFAYVLGLGLLTLRGGEYVISNPIYREVIPRVLSFDQQVQIHLNAAAYVRPGGGLDLPRLMADWQRFWREDGQVSVAHQTSYREAGPHLMLMAFLQRIVNGGGRIEREYALGRGALDLMIYWRDERHAIEVKVRRDAQTEERAIGQLDRYLERAGLPLGWLVLFDPRKRRSWKEKLTLRKRKRGERVIWLVGC